jgi:hypothetical protein
MKVLFLDIDGVLNCLGDEAGHGAVKSRVGRSKFVGLDPEILTIYRDMIARLEVVVVLSSAWRTLPDLCRCLEQNGVAFDDITPCADPTLDRLRGYEIQLWLDQFPVVKRYAILDDGDDMLEYQMPNFFQASPQTGLTLELANKIVAHFTY